MINHLVPSAFYLGQNYPNPFKEKTIIKYCVAFTSNVQITVYDAEGKEVKKLVDEEHQPGTYQVEFSTTQCLSRKNGNLKDGYYCYRMTAGSYSSEKKWFCKN
ncbi:MAG TPA: T9SS type A sorting domain-containing protein, partial [Ignavibacteriaceae bacterium]